MATYHTHNQQPIKQGAAPASLARVRRPMGAGPAGPAPASSSREPHGGPLPAQTAPPRRRATPGRYSAKDQARRMSGVAGQASRRAAASRRGAAPRGGFMKYATDNRIVQFFYELTTGPKRIMLYLAVLALVLVGLYFPARDYYTAFRTKDILQQQLAIRDEYKDTLGKDVDSLLSQEGVEDAARRDLDMVKPGEKALNVTGLKDGEPVVKKEGEPKDEPKQEDEDKRQPLKGKDAANNDKGPQMSTAPSGEAPKTGTEAEAAERAVFENSPWYFKVLDTIFGFDGKNGMAVVATGGAAK